MAKVITWAVPAETCEGPGGVVALMREYMGTQAQVESGRGEPTGDAWVMVGNQKAWSGPWSTAKEFYARTCRTGGFRGLGMQPSSFGGMFGDGEYEPGEWVPKLRYIRTLINVHYRTKEAVPQAEWKKRLSELRRSERELVRHIEARGKDVPGGYEGYDGDLWDRYKAWLKTYPVRMRNAIMRMAGSSVKAVPLLIQAVSNRAVLTNPAWWKEALKTNWGVALYHTLTEKDPRPEHWKDVMRGVDEKQLQSALVKTASMVRAK